MGITILGVVAVMVAAVGIGTIMRITDDAKDRQGEATTAQWTSMRFARDVQSASAVAPQCAPGTGSRLLTLAQVGVGGTPGTVEYRVVESDGLFDVSRVTCDGDTQTSLVVAHELAHRPTVTCDGGSCIEGTTPRVVTLQVEKNSRFNFTLDGVRRTTDGNIPPDQVPTLTPAFVSLGASVKFSGSPKLNITGDAYINKPSSGNALTISGSAQLNVTGGLFLESGATIKRTGSSQIPGSTDTLAARFPDPLRFLAEPDTTGLPVRTECTKTGGIYVCLSGIYNADFPPSGSGSKEFVLQPGIYVLRGGMSPSGSVRISGDGGVLLYNQSGAVSISGTVKMNLSAPDSGPYAGILYFQSRSNTSNVKITGSGNVTSLDGLVYAPNANDMDLSGGGDKLHLTGVIAKDFTISGSGEVNLDGN